MVAKNKFGFEPMVEPESPETSRQRQPGPMSVAVRETAESLRDATDVKVDLRRQNAAAAKEFQEAKKEGRVLVSLSLGQIDCNDIPRDRLDLSAVAESDEMDELKASIQARGQREPIEVIQTGADHYQLKKGWRRMEALRQLFSETGDARFSVAVARVTGDEGNRLARFVDMVEENIIREDLTFAEMAQLAIRAAEDPAVKGDDPVALVNQLYVSLHKMKRSYIRSFVYLLLTLGDDLRWPRYVARNLGVEVSRRIKADPALREALCVALQNCDDPAQQTSILGNFTSESGAFSRPSGGDQVERTAPSREKFEFHVGKIKVTARQGELRILDSRDYTDVSRERLERAIHAFNEVLKA